MSTQRIVPFHSALREMSKGQLCAELEEPHQCDLQAPKRVPVYTRVHIAIGSANDTDRSLLKPSSGMSERRI